MDFIYNNKRRLLNNPCRSEAIYLINKHAGLLRIQSVSRKPIEVFSDTPIFEWTINTIHYETKKAFCYIQIFSEEDLINRVKLFCEIKSDYPEYLI